MLQATILNCLFLDLFPFSENVFVTSEVDVCRRDVVQALVIAVIVVMIDERFDLLLQIDWQVVVFQKNAVLHGLMPAFDFALGLRVEWSATDVFHLLLFHPFSQITRDVARTIVTKQARLVLNDSLIATRRSQSQFNSLCHIAGPHGRAELPCDDVAAEIIQNGAQIIPTPSDDLNVGKVCLPRLIDSGGFVLELFGSFDHHVIRRGNKVRFLQSAVSRCFRNKILFLVGIFDCQLTCCQRFMNQCKLNYVITAIVGDSVPDGFRVRGLT